MTALPPPATPPTTALIAGGSEAAGAALGAALLSTVLYAMAVVTSVVLVKVVTGAMGGSRRFSRWSAPCSSVQPSWSHGRRERAAPRPRGCDHRSRGV